MTTKQVGQRINLLNARAKDAIWRAYNVYGKLSGTPEAEIFHECQDEIDRLRDQQRAGH